MRIIDYFFDETDNLLIVEYSIIVDDIENEEKIELDIWDIEYYTTNYHLIKDLPNITEDDVYQIVSQYLNENELT